MYEPEFSEQEALNLLIQSGWYKGRKVEVDTFQIKLAEARYEIFPYAEGFLTEFGYLRVTYPYNSGHEYEAFSINPNDIFMNRNAPPLKAYEASAGVQLCALGESHQGHALLMIGSDGCLYGGFDEYFWQEQGEGLTALLAIIRNEPPVWKTEVTYSE